MKTKATLIFALSLFIYKAFLYHPDTKRPTVKRLESTPNLFVQDRLDYEFDMLKDPSTGKIPEGIRSAELAFAENAPVFLGRSAQTFTSLGPDNFGGRTRAIAYDLRANGVVIAGGVSSGLFRSTTNGNTWVRVTPPNEIHNITCIAQDPRAGFQDTWYYATGEALGNSASATGAFYFGNGVYKSTDNGINWTRLANSNPSVWENFDHQADLISNIAINPSNGHVFAAALQAIMRTTDGGTTWTTVLGGGVSNSSQMTDILAAANDTLYAGFSGTSTSGVDGVYISTTGGGTGTWTRIASSTLVTGWHANAAYRRVVLGKVPGNAGQVYALYAKTTNPACTIEGGFFKYYQNTNSWVNLSANLPDEPGCLAGNDPFAVQTGYDLVVSVKPNDTNTVFVGGTNIYMNSDGFKTTTSTKRIGGYVSASSYGLYLNHHPDIHALIFKPGFPDSLVSGSDGGIHITNSTQPTISWRSLNNGYITYQYYHAVMNQNTGNNEVLGGLQDNGTKYANGGMSHTDYLSGDGCYAGISRTANRYYASSQSGTVAFLNGAYSGYYISQTIRSNKSLFVTLFHLMPDSTEHMYLANGNELFRTTSASTVVGSTWTYMSGISGQINTANTIRSFATTRGTYNPLTTSLYIGASNGKVWRVPDPANVTAASTSAIDITPTGMTTAGRVVSAIAVNPRNDDTLLVVYSNYGLINIWWTGNAKSETPTWVNVEGNLTIPSIRSARILVKPTGVEYYVGTSIGLFSTTSPIPSSTVWTREGAESIAYAIVTTLDSRTTDNTMLVATHGNGLFSLIQPPLPVTWVNFWGKREGTSAKLQWTTTDERNNKGFVLERKDGDFKPFVEIGFVSPQISSSSTKNYMYLDENAPEGLLYYRLKQVDLDGKFDYSRTILINGTKPSKIEVKTFPNPANSYINIQIKHKLLEASYTLEVYDLTGKLHLRESQLTESQTLSIERLQTGIYMVQIKQNNEAVFTQKLFVSR